VALKLASILVAFSANVVESCTRKTGFSMRKCWHTRLRMLLIGCERADTVRATLSDAAA
jgi:hypothetical protein